MKTPLALIITFNPEQIFFQHLSTSFKEFSHILVIDNHSCPDVQKRLIQKETDKLTVILNQKNLGVAAALNQGFEWAYTHGFEHILTFDQDSYLQEGSIKHLEDVFLRYPAEKLAIVASTIHDPTVKKQAKFLRARTKWRFEWSFCRKEILEDISFAITAGSLYSLEAYRELGAFRDDFFIDYVDEEYCLRANQKGYKIIAACNARINHQLGEREKRILFGHTFYPTFHSPLRWYYISRNRISMLKTYAYRFPHWFFYEIIASSYTLIRMLFFENHRKLKLEAVFLGTTDGLRGKMGKARNEIVKKLSN